MELKIGLGKTDITCFLPGIGMMGYGQHHNLVKSIATPLWARILFIRSPSPFILIHLEQAFVSIAIKEEVLKRINSIHPEWKIGRHNLVITAQHTHSAPGGYSHYPLYNFTIPGFQRKVFEKIVSSIIEGIIESSRHAETVKANWGEYSVSPDKEVAFNRSMIAYASNPEKRYSGEDQKHLAVDRKMQGLSLTNLEGKRIAFLHWFGVHCTSISSFNTRIHHDNKGVAADLFEKNHPGTMAFFLQSAAGDISPNFIWDKKLKRMRGKFTDQYESAAFNGELQFRESEKIETKNEISSELDAFHTFLDMSVEVGTPAHGVSFFRGTLEGPGVPGLLGDLLEKISDRIRGRHLLKNPEVHQAFYNVHGEKKVLLDHRSGSFLGIPLSAWKKLPKLPEPSIESLRVVAKQNALETLPWVPVILPFQMLKIGNLIILFVPGEITFIAGKRLKEFIKAELVGLNVEDVILTSYSNAYMGYITTPEEYDKQCYEGGHTVYGRETLRGIMKGFSVLCSQLKRTDLSDIYPKEPFHFPDEELARRSFY